MHWMLGKRRGKMRVHLKGINKAMVRLANGERVTYYYAWRGGPRLVGEPGSPEFIAELLCRNPIPARAGPRNVSFRHRRLQGIQDFLGLSPRSQSDYLKQIKKIEAKFADLPIAALDDARVTREFLEWRDSMAGSPRQADYAWTILMRLCSWARARGLTLYRPPERVERLYHADRSEKIWEETHLAAFLAVASDHCSGRWCSRWKPDSGKATCSRCRGPPMTGNGFVCGKPRPDAASISR